MTWPVWRGQVVRADVGLPEPKLFVIVSNNRRNQALPQVLGVRLTSGRKPALPSVVELTPADPLIGRAVCDDIVIIHQDNALEVVGSISPPTMTAIGNGLRAALDLR